METGEPLSKWFFAAGIDEASFKSTVSKLCDHQASPDRTETYLLAISIIYRKTSDLLKARTPEKTFRFSSLEALETEREFGIPDYETGGLVIWLLDATGQFQTNRTHQLTRS